MFNEKCQKCSKGTSNKATNRCEECGINEYLEDGQCKKCPFDKYAYPGSIGENSCIKKQVCGQKDMVATLSECKDGFRTKSYSNRQPITCLEQGNLLAEELVECNRCGRGERLSL